MLLLYKHLGIFLLTLQGPAVLCVLLGTLDSDHNSYKILFFSFCQSKMNVFLYWLLNFNFFSLPSFLFVLFICKIDPNSVCDLEKDDGLPNFDWDNLEWSNNRVTTGSIK